MDYEQAKELKEAGFPQEFGKGYKSHGKIPINATAEEMKRIEVYFPTLSELIEACGDEFYSLVFALDNDWRCFSETDEVNSVATADGKTPEEAAARLWLALNKTTPQTTK